MTAKQRARVYRKAAIEIANNINDIYFICNLIKHYGLYFGEEVEMFRPLSPGFGNAWMSKDLNGISLERVAQNNDRILALLFMEQIALSND